MSGESQANDANPGGNGNASDSGSPGEGQEPGTGTPGEGGQQPDGGKPTDGGQPKAGEGEQGGSPEGGFTPFEIDKTFGFSEEQQKTYGEFAKSQNYTQEQAQANVTFFEKTLREMGDAAFAEEKAVREGWKKDAMNDEEIGGDDFKEKHSIADQVMNSLGSPAKDDKGNPVRHPETGKPMSDIGVIMEETGLGNHKAFIKMFYRLREVLSEDTLAGMTGGDNAPKPKTAAEIMFPNQGK